MTNKTTDNFWEAFNTMSSEQDTPAPVAWECAAIDHGVTIFPNGKIGPCCLIAGSYLKPISTITDPNRFADLKTIDPPSACNKCVQTEAQHQLSYRQKFNQQNTGAPGLQFVDIRNTNQCNLKCRYCGPHFSNQWAKELNYETTLLYQDLPLDQLINDSLHWMYFTGGEPLINPEHWNLLEHLIDIGRANSITLMYNTNLTTLKYKQKNIIDIWKQFKNVTISCSIDAIGKPLEYIRSGADWKKINTHIEQLISTTKDSSIKIAITPVISILNIWFLEELIIFAKQRNIEVNPNILTGPDYLSIDVMPDFLKELALEKILSIAKHQTIPTTVIKQLMEMIKNNASQQCLFQHTVSHILLLDNLRDEKLFNLLPFNEVSINNILRNREYE